MYRNASCERNNVRDKHVQRGYCSMKMVHTNHPEESRFLPYLKRRHKSLSPIKLSRGFRVAPGMQIRKQHTKCKRTPLPFIPQRVVPVPMRQLRAGRQRTARRGGYPAPSFVFLTLMTSWLPTMAGRSTKFILKDLKSGLATWLYGYNITCSQTGSPELFADISENRLAIIYRYHV